MKFITRFLLIYLTVTLVVLSIGGYMSYFIIQDELNKELKWRFLDRVNRVTYLLEQGTAFNDTTQVGDQEDRNLSVTQLPEQVEPTVEVSDTMVWNQRLQQMEPNLKLEAYRTIGNNSYYITTFGALVETDDITDAVTKIFLWILGLQVLGAIGVGFILSNRLFKPFRNTLEKIKAFKLQDKQPIEAEKNTGVKEFDDLNNFVEAMTRKAVSDYKNLKEFAENASHELQTPLSITKGKMELLTETDLTPEQYKYVEASQRSVKKLSRLSESLALLTKIENHEFKNSDEVNFTKLIRESTQSFEELIQLSGLKVVTDLEEEVIIHIHPVLADILWTNLFQNAIKHNVDGGEIRIKLTSAALEISNTGRPSDNPEAFFGRFKKGEHSTHSIGLGLSIIKHIVEQNQYDITYENRDHWHNIQIEFSRKEKSLKDSF